MSVMVLVHDGPLAGECWECASCPEVVRCVRGMDGKTDILNLPEDEPALGEEVYWYRWDGNPPGHVCYSRPRRGYAVIGLVHAPLESFPAPREADCEHDCCKAGDEGLFSELVR
jgi:hypothetical protein